MKLRELSRVASQKSLERRLEMNHEIRKELVIKQGWVPSIGADLSAEHFRQPPPSTGHAVCKGDWCLIHNDKVNPLADPLEHLRVDSPPHWVLVTTLAGAGVGALVASAKDERDAKLEWAVIGGAIGCFIGLLTARLN
jgi:hypothetical protein